MAITNEQIIKNCNDVLSITKIADTDNFFSSILFNGVQLTLSQVSSVSYKGVPITSDPIVPCDTFTTNINVGTITNQTLDIKEICDSGEALLSFHFIGKTLKQLEYVLTESMPNALITTYFSTGSEYTYEYKATPSASYTSYTQSQFINVIASGAIGGSIRITYTGSYEIDQLLTIKYLFSADQTTPNLSYTTVKVDHRAVFGTTQKVQLANITAPNSVSLFLGVNANNATTDNWTLYPHDILTGAGLTAANNALNALTPPYAVRLFNEYNATSTSGAMDAKVDFVGDLGKLRKVTVLGARNNPNFRDFGTALFYDGTTDFTEIGETALGQFGAIASPYTAGGTAKEHFFNTVNFNRNFTLSFWHFHIPGQLFYIGYQEQNTALGVGGVSTQNLFNFTVGDTYVGSLWRFSSGGVASQMGVVSFARIEAGWNYITYVNRAVADVNANNPDVDHYVDGRKLSVSLQPTNWNIASIPYANYPFGYPCRIMGAVASNPSANSPANAFLSGRNADLMFTAYAMTGQDVEQIYTRGTNVAANYASYYPANVLNNRFLHLTMNTPQFINNTPAANQHTITDLSGKNNRAIVYGQGASPTTVGFYS